MTKTTAAETPAAERPGLARQALQAVKGLLTYAPEIKDLADVVQQAVGTSA